MAGKKPVKKPMSRKQLKKTKGGAVDAFRATTRPLGTINASGPGDEGPEEKITFVYGK